MDPTTLVTFLFNAPIEVRTVELLGSWDNFAIPYKMHNDRRRGRGFWSGCFRFHDIIFDGDKAEWSKPRSGGLKQGGTYWYYYRLNDDVEAYDDAAECTTNCPLLPGQWLNVIEVPVEVADVPRRRRSMTLDVPAAMARLASRQTLDPNNRALDPPPISRVHGRCISDMALNGRLETNPQSYREAESRPQPNYSPPMSGESRRSPRYYARSRPHSGGDRSSLQSRPSWRSGSRSCATSFVFEAFETEAYNEGDQDVPPFPLPDIYQPSGARPVTRSRQDPDFGFDCGVLPDTSSPPSSHHYGDEDVDGTSFILESPSPQPSSDTEQQFSNRPSTGAEYQYSNRQSSEINVSSPSNRQSSDLDLSSPSFSAATVSSSDGVNTPFRLSTTTCPSQIQRSLTDDPGNYTIADNIAHITERLRHLGSEDSAGSLPSQVSEDHEERPFFAAGYALPGNESVPTLRKMSSTHASIARNLPGLASMGDSVEDDLFDDLAYLRGSIA